MTVGEAALVGRGVVPNKAPTTTPKTVEQQAKELKSLNNNKNTVNINTTNGKVQYDLDGKAHYNKSTKTTIETPHTRTYTKHVNPNNSNQFNYTAQDVQRMTQQAVRTVKKFLKKTFKEQKHD